MDTAWQEFVDTYYKGIYFFCLQFLGNKAEAEDATQDTFISAFKHRSELRTESKERSWIYSIARNRCIDATRFWKRFLKKPTDAQRTDTNREDNFDAFESTAAVDSDLSLTLRKLITALPTRQREIFILRHFQGFSTTEVALMLKIDEGTVKSQLKRAVDRLKIEITPLL